MTGINPTFFTCMVAFFALSALSSCTGIGNPAQTGGPSGRTLNEWRHRRHRLPWSQVIPLTFPQPRREQRQLLQADSGSCAAREWWKFRKFPGCAPHPKGHYSSNPLSLVPSPGGNRRKAALPLLHLTLGQVHARKPRPRHFTSAWRCWSDVMPQKVVAAVSLRLMTHF